MIGAHLGYCVHRKTHEAIFYRNELRVIYMNFKETSRVWTMIVMIGVICAALLFAGHASSVAHAQAPTPTKYWTNVRDYGAVGDDVHDDGPAIVSAVTAAIKGGTRVVYFPPAKAYLVSGLTLPPDCCAWIKLVLDAPIYTTGTITVPSFYSIFGNSSGLDDQFSYDDGVQINGVNPNLTGSVVDVVGSHVNLENLFVDGAQGTADAIRFENSVCCVTLTNVAANILDPNTEGAAVRIQGGFNFVFEKSFFSVPTDGQAPTISIEPDHDLCNSTGLIRMRDVVLAGRGIAASFPCGIGNQFNFENMLYEAAVDSFLTITNRYGAVDGGWVDQISIRNIAMSDCNVEPCPSLIRNNGHRTLGVQVYESGTPTNPAWIGPIVSGDQITGLEIWTTDEYPVGQASGYIYHLPTKVISTIPIVAPTASSVKPAPRGGPRVEQPRIR
jgi:hypothetical protein